MSADRIQQLTMANRTLQEQLAEANARIAALSTEPAPQVMCKQCGNPTMHDGDVCYGCAHPEYAALEREHLGDPERRTGIYAGAAPLPDEGCDYCRNPLFAGTKCKHCGRVFNETPLPDEVASMVERLHDADLETILKLRAEVTQLRSQIAALEKDAERYRWLRDNVYDWAFDGTAEENDNAVDAAIAQQKEGGE